MSKALDFLIKTRPEAMQAYFSFLKQAGSHLDKKTAALISVITKVHAKTANGLRQYLPRALKEGASADEIIDALLFAMPALGFSKIVWAIDVILEMDLPEFNDRLNQKIETPNQAQWQVLTDAAAVRQNEPRLFKVGELWCYAVRDGESVQIFDAHCPHKGNLIPETGIGADSLTCPFHDRKYDLRSGQCIAGGKNSEFLKKIESKIEDGKILVHI